MSRISYDRILERRVIILSAATQHEPEHQYNYRSRGVANVHIEGDWNILGLDIGNQRVDTLYRESNTRVFDICEGNSCIPFLKFHRIQFIYTGEFSILSYDIVSLNTPESFEIIHKSQQFTGKVNTNMTVESIPLLFNQCVENLLVHCEHTVTDIKFLYDKYDIYSAKPLIKKTDTQWELDASVNFSKADWPILEVWTPTTNTMRVFATGYQTVQCNYGMMRII